MGLKTMNPTTTQHFAISHSLTIIILFLLAVACSPDASREMPGGESADGLAGRVETPVTAELAGVRRERLKDHRPSVVLVVLDTVRADAVSSYGEVEGTTPHFDALAAEGIRYNLAFAPAPWTVASHASLFSGLRVDQHGVGLNGLVVVPEFVDMLAEDFRDAGYTTASFSANAVIDEDFGFERGFDWFESSDLIGRLTAHGHGEVLAPFRVLGRVREWNRRRDRSRPYFLFVNIFDAHDPYEVRETNRWVPDGVERSEIDYIASKYDIPRSLCDGVPTKKHLDVLRGLYHGDVARADEKLGELLELIEDGDEATSRIVVVTSDHGEHLGENRLMGHRFSVRNTTLHIPLVVTGLLDSSPTVIDDPVELRSIRSSLLCWALGRSCSESLPTTDGDRSQAEPTSNPIFSIYSDSVVSVPDWMLDRLGLERGDELPSQARVRCKEEDPVFGEMVSMVRYPMKITWFSKHQPALHDLRWDTAERFDQMKRQPEMAASLLKEIEGFVRLHVLDRDTSDVPELSVEAMRRLEQLGYVE